MRGQVRIYQKKIVAKKRRRAILLSLYSALALALAASALSYVSHLEAFQIAKVSVEGNSRLSAAAIESIVDTEASGNYLGLFSRRNSFLFPREKIEKAVLALPEVKAAEISREGLGVVSVALEERKEAAIWCGAAKGECFSLDENGLVFGKRATTTLDEFTYRGAIEGDPVGKRFLGDGEFKKLEFFISQLSGLSVLPRAASIGSTGYVTIALEDGGKVIFHKDDDLSLVLGNIAAIISDKAVAPSFSEFLKNLDYIKLDSGNKAVYKMKK